MFTPVRMRPDWRYSGGQFECIDVPKIEGIGSGVSERYGGESIAAGSEDCVDLVMGR